MGPGTAGRWEAGGPGPPVPAQPLTLSGRLRRNHRIDAGHQAGEEVLEEEQGILPGKAQVSEAQRQGGPPQALFLTGLLTWSTLSRRGISETRRQHSGPPRLVVGATCRALMVSWGQRASSGYSLGLGPLRPPCALIQACLSPGILPGSPTPWWLAGAAGTMLEWARRGSRSLVCKYRNLLIWEEASRSRTSSSCTMNTWRDSGRSSSSWLGAAGPAAGSAGYTSCWKLTCGEAEA